MNTLIAILHRMATVLGALLAGLIFGILLASCELTKDIPDPEAAEAARSALVEWLECEECTEGQLNRVLIHNKQLQPMLVSTLEKGVSPASKALYQYQLEKRYDELVEYARTHPNAKPSLPKQDFVKLYMDNFDAQYRSRAAKALGSIGGDASRDALEKALHEKQREDVRQVIEASLKEIR